MSSAYVNVKTDGTMRQRRCCPRLWLKKAKLGEDDLKVAITLHELGVYLRENGRYNEAEEMLRKALVEESKAGRG